MQHAESCFVMVLPTAAAIYLTEIFGLCFGGNSLEVFYSKDLPASMSLTRASQ